MSFRLGFPELAHDMKWLGRRYFSGLLHGVAMCWLCYGLFIRTGPLSVAGELTYILPLVLMLIGMVMIAKRPKASEHDSTNTTDDPRIAAETATPSEGDASENE